MVKKTGNPLAFANLNGKEVREGKKERGDEGGNSCFLVEGLRGSTGVTLLASPPPERNDLPDW